VGASQGNRPAPPQVAPTPSPPLYAQRGTDVSRAYVGSCRARWSRESGATSTRRRGTTSIPRRSHWTKSNVQRSSVGSSTSTRGRRHEWNQGLRPLRGYGNRGYTQVVAGGLPPEPIEPVRTVVGAIQFSIAFALLSAASDNAPTAVQWHAGACLARWCGRSQPRSSLGRKAYPFGAGLPRKSIRATAGSWSEA